MKILHLSAFDNEGGAARAAGRLHYGLLDKEVESWMAVRRKGGDGKNVILAGKEGAAGKVISMLRPYIDALPLALYRNKRNIPWTVAWLPNQLERVTRDICPDIVHLHWTGTGFLSLCNLSKVKAKIVWTLHDAWPFTGGCHIINDCVAFGESCGRCSQLGSNNKYDLSKFGWCRKKRLYTKQHPAFIAPSRWMAEQAKSSTLLSDAKIKIIPNGLDTNVYTPIDKKVARNLLKLPVNKKIIMFGSMSATSDPNKGFDKLIRALSQLKESGIKDQIQLAVFGAVEPVDKPAMGFETTYLGRFYDDISLAAVYSAADVMCVPSIQESFGQTASESMSCGTPVVAFAISGLLDIVEHGVSGYLAKPYDVIDLAEGLELMLSDNVVLNNMSIAARNRVVELFDVSIISSKHILLYEQILSE